MNEQEIKLQEQIRLIKTIKYSSKASLDSFTITSKLNADQFEALINLPDTLSSLLSELKDKEDMLMDLRQRFL